MANSVLKFDVVVADSFTTRSLSTNKFSELICVLNYHERQRVMFVCFLVVFLHHFLQRLVILFLCAFSVFLLFYLSVIYCRLFFKYWCLSLCVAEVSVQPFPSHLLPVQTTWTTVHSRSFTKGRCSTGTTGIIFIIKIDCREEHAESSMKHIELFPEGKVFLHICSASAASHFLCWFTKR